MPVDCFIEAADILYDYIMINGAGSHELLMKTRQDLAVDFEMIDEVVRSYE